MAVAATGDGAARRVIVVGAGPVGLTIACLLGRAGIDVDLMESQATLPEDPRASTFHPPTLELLSPLGITDELISQGVICPHWQVRWHPSGERAVFDLAVLADETPYPYRLQCEQWKLAQAVHRRLGALPNVRVHLGCEVTTLEQRVDRVVVGHVSAGRHGRTSAAWLVGADGAHSFVRKALDLSLEGDTYPETILIVETDFPFEEHLEGLSFSTYCWRDGGNFSMLRLRDRWRIGIYPLQGMTVDEQLSDANIEAMLQSIVRRPRPYRILARRPYRAHNRIAPRYRVGRAFLAGDAAHLNSPTGGMGLNGGLHDAFNLAEKLVTVMRGDAPSSLLDRYERQRRPVALEEILAQADRNRARMRESDPERRRDLLTDLQATAADRVRLKAMVMRSSMIAGWRRAAQVE